MTASLPALENDPKMVVFTDWDGTVTLQDSNDYLTDNLGFGVEKRAFINQQILDGVTNFRDGFIEMLNSITVPFPECVEYLKQHVQLDPGFADFYNWAHANNIPVVVVSSGMKPIIQALLTKLVGEEAVKILRLLPMTLESIQIIHGISCTDTLTVGFGHDKSKSLRPYAQVPNRPPLFYCGDGVSDLSAARETDLLFAKAGRDLVTYCQREKIPYVLFHSFKDIHEKIQAIY